MRIKFTVSSLFKAKWKAIVVSKPILTTSKLKVEMQPLKIVTRKGSKKRSSGSSMEPKAKKTYTVRVWAWSWSFSVKTTAASSSSWWLSMVVRAVSPTALLCRTTTRCKNCAIWSTPITWRGPVWSGRSASHTSSTKHRPSSQLCSNTCKSTRTSRTTS